MICPQRGSLSQIYTKKNKHIALDTILIKIWISVSNFVLFIFVHIIFFQQVMKKFPRPISTIGLLKWLLIGQYHEMFFYQANCKLALKDLEMLYLNRAQGLFFLTLSLIGSINQQNIGFDQLARRRMWRLFFKSRPFC